MEKHVATACRLWNTNRMSNLPGVYHSKIFTETHFLLFPRSLCFPWQQTFLLSPPHLRALVHTSPAGVSTSLERKRDKISRRRTARARSTRSPPERLSGQKTAKQKRQRFSVHIVLCTNQKGSALKKRNEQNTGLEQPECNFRKSNREEDACLWEQRTC